MVNPSLWTLQVVVAEVMLLVNQSDGARHFRREPHRMTLDLLLEGI